MKSKKIIGILLSILVVSSFVLTACNKTSYEGSTNIAEPSEIEALMESNDVIVIDARPQEEYVKGHLQGAINLTPGELSIHKPIKNMLAPKEQIEEILSSKGISNNSTLLIYDNSGGVYSGRLWWTLKVYGHDNVKVINQGQEGIVEEKLPLTKEVPNLLTTNYVAKDADTDKIATMEYVKDVTENSPEGVCIIDVRSTAEYDEGAIPGAILYPHTQNLYSDGTFRSGRDTYLNYHDLGIDRDDTIILYCKSSYRAAQTALVLEEAGYENIKIYDGAWLEWSAGDNPTEEKEETVAPTVQDAS